MWTEQTVLRHLDRERLRPMLNTIAARRQRIAAERKRHELPTGRLAELLYITSCICGFSQEKLLAHNRTIPISRARHIYFYAAHKLTFKSLPQIGRSCGNRHHTTVLHGRDKVEADRQYFEPHLSEVIKAFQDNAS